MADLAIYITVILLWVGILGNNYLIDHNQKKTESRLANLEKRVRFGWGSDE